MQYLIFLCRNSTAVIILDWQDWIKRVILLAGNLLAFSFVGQLCEFIFVIIFMANKLSDVSN